MDPLLTAIVLWLSVNFGLPETYDHPAIERRPRAQIAALHYGESRATARREVKAVYDDASRRIYLPIDWSGRTPADLSVLVHEMVHHLQNAAGLSFPCPAAREKTAYDAQDAWLDLFGKSLTEEFDLDAMTLKLSTQCLPY